MQRACLYVRVALVKQNFGALARQGRPVQRCGDFGPAKLSAQPHRTHRYEIRSLAYLDQATSLPIRGQGTQRLSSRASSYGTCCGKIGSRTLFYVQEVRDRRPCRFLSGFDLDQS